MQGIIVRAAVLACTICGIAGFSVGPVGLGLGRGVSKGPFARASGKAALALRTARESSSSSRVAVSLLRMQAKPGGTDDEDFAGTVLKNTMEGQVGARGELYVAGQLLLLFLVIIAPALEGLLEDLGLPLGLLFCAGGLGIGGKGVVDLGRNLTPWPKPIDNAVLKTGGVYGVVRHPLYGGLLLTCFGLSVIGMSFPRLFFTTLLYALLNAKAEMEEEFMTEAFKDYRRYQETTRNRLIPYAAELRDLIKNATK